MLVRQRQPDDLAACVAALAAVHALDNYPTRWPDDPAAWLTPAPFLAAWVACEREIGADPDADAGAPIAGHVALSAVADDAKAEPWVVASGLGAARLAEVGRLFVAPGHRGRGLGARLLATASAEARERGLLPALKVLDHDRAAVALYERAGWRRVASLTTNWRVSDPTMALLHYYLAPAYRSARGTDGDSTSDLSGEVADMTHTLTARVSLVAGDRFNATTGSGGAADMAPAAEDGETTGAISPMEALLVALAGCLGMSVTPILRKTRQRVTRYEISASGALSARPPRVFETIIVAHTVVGVELDHRAIERAIALAEERYCGASAMLGKAARISHTISITDTDDAGGTSDE